MRPTLRSGIAVAAMLLVVLLTSCSGGDGSASAPPSFNDADVTFVQGMIPHHEQAIEMAEIALDPSSGASTRTKELAQKIRDAQDPEVRQMRSLLEAWGRKELSTMTDHAEHGMLEAKDLTALDALTGPAFDQRFAALMIQHHQGAVDQSEKVRSSGRNTDVKELAETIIRTQKAEIEELRPLTV